MIHYKFRQDKGKWKSVSFEGSVLSVIDVKKGILRQNKKLIEAKGDFDLRLTNAQTGEVYLQDQYLIPKNTSVCVKKIPCRHSESLKNKITPEEIQAEYSHEEVDKSGESEKMKELMYETSILYKSTSRPGGRNINLYQTPPPGYVCHRCGEEGHFIKYCPTNGDPNFNIRRIRKPTGIPRSFLQPIEDVKGILKDKGQKEKENILAGGTVTLPEGTVAVARPNLEAWQKEFNQKKPQQPALPAPKKYENLTCPLCNNYFKNAVAVPCCYASFCDECIRQALIGDDDTAYVCPLCKAPDISPELLIVNPQLQKRVAELTEQPKPTYIHHGYHDNRYNTNGDLNYHGNSNLTYNVNSNLTYNTNYDANYHNAPNYLNTAQVVRPVSYPQIKTHPIQTPILFSYPHTHPHAHSQTHSYVPVHPHQAISEPVMPVCYRYGGVGHTDKGCSLLGAYEGQQITGKRMRGNEIGGNGLSKNQRTS